MLELRVALEAFLNSQVCDSLRVELGSDVAGYHGFNQIGKRGAVGATAGYVQSDGPVAKLLAQVFERIRRQLRGERE